MTYEEMLAHVRSGKADHARDTDFASAVKEHGLVFYPRPFNERPAGLYKPVKRADGVYLRMECVAEIPR